MNNRPEGEPKNHHYIPKCYSKNFGNNDGYIYVMDLWEDCKIYASRPEAALKERYLYSQPVHADSRYDNRMEKFFDREVETEWPAAYDDILKKAEITNDRYAYIVQFYLSMLARVPIHLNSVVELLQQSVMDVCKRMETPELPQSLIDAYQKKTGKFSTSVGLHDLVDAGINKIEIDPHTAITSMPHISNSHEGLWKGKHSFGKLKFLHNKTSLPFISSDNPVCFHNDFKSYRSLKPYPSENKKSFEFIFPLSSDIALVNQGFHKNLDSHIDVHDTNVIAHINRITSLFAYRYVYSGNPDHLKVGRKFFDICPRPVFKKSLVGDGIVYKIHYELGRTTQIKNSWKYDF